MPDSDNYIYTDSDPTSGSWGVFYAYFFFCAYTTNVGGTPTRV